MKEKNRIKMTMNSDLINDAEVLDELTRNLREELIELDIESADLIASGGIPSRAKAIEPVTYGTILVTLAASGGVLTSLISLVQSWLSRHELSSITLEIDGDKLEVKSISAEEQKKLINIWISHHAKET